MQLLVLSKGWLFDFTQIAALGEGFSEGIGPRSGCDTDSLSSWLC